MTLFDTGIRPAIDKYLADKAKEKRNYGEYWPASSAGYCMRLNILKRLDIPAVPEIAEDQARTTRVFESGHVFHEWIQRITKDAGLSIAQELELQDEDLMVRGHFDDLVLIPGWSEKVLGITEEILENNRLGKPNTVVTRDNSKLILYDYKTANSQAFNYKRDEMGYYHKMQLGTYMYMLRKLTPQIIDGYIGDHADMSQYHSLIQNLTEARILTISKDDLRLREQQLFWSEDLEKQVVAYWRSLQDFWDKKTLPPCTCLDHDGGFMGKRSKKGKVYNPYYHNDEPCSEAWVKHLLPGGWTCL